MFLVRFSHALATIILVGILVMAKNFTKFSTREKFYQFFGDINCSPLLLLRCGKLYFQFYDYFSVIYTVESPSHGNFVHKISSKSLILISPTNLQNAKICTR